MLPDRTTFLRSVAAVVLVAAIGLLFIASYAGALHDPQPQGDLRGGVSFYVAVGWVIAGYLATSLLSVACGPRPGRLRVACWSCSCGRRSAQRSRWPSATVR